MIPEKHQQPCVWDGPHNNFDALRLLLALLVLASHSFALGVGSEANEPVLRWTHGQLTGGAIAVDLFFVMSGFMIAASMERSRSARQFVERRVTRIYPAFVVCALLGFLVVAPISHAILLPNVALRVGDFLLQTLRLREFSYSHAFPGNAYRAGVINGSTWSIQYEVWCYVGVLLLGVSGLLRRRVWPLVFFVASVLLSVGFLTRGWSPGGKFLGVLLGTPAFWARLLPYYLVGVVFYLYRRSIPHTAWLAAVSVLLLLVAARVPLGVAVLFPLAGTYLTFYLAYARWLPLSQAGRFGDFSYGLYLYAFPIQQLVVMQAGGTMSPVRLFLIAAPLTLIAAVGSWYGVERRWLRPGRRHESVVQAVVAQ